MIAFVAALLTCIPSLVGVLFLGIRRNKLSKLVSMLVAFAVGALIAASAKMLLKASPFWMIIGVFTSIAIEQVFRWHHCHDIECKHVIGWINLLGDALHNFTDGVAIAASFMTNFGLGITTTLSILAHEIPQEIGDSAVLLHAGFKLKKVVALNFLVALSAIIGVAFGKLVGGLGFAPSLLGFSAGNFLYIALSGLLPELRKATKKEGMIKMALMIAGVTIIWLL